MLLWGWNKVAKNYKKNVFFYKKKHTKKIVLVVAAVVVLFAKYYLLASHPMHLHAQKCQKSSSPKSVKKLVQFHTKNGNFSGMAQKHIPKMVDGR